jgi:hypothetical protein
MQRYRDAQEHDDEPSPDLPGSHRHKRVDALPPLPDGDRAGGSPQSDPCSAAFDN